MAHPQQQEFCKSIQQKYPDFFKESLVLDIGSLDINGNNQYLFENSLYFGVDVAAGRNVDIISKGHELMFHDATFDLIISTECFEHDQYYPDTIKNIYRMLKPGGMFIFTCATTGRPEHGTSRTTPHDAPLLQSIENWSDYYKNLTESDIRDIFDIDMNFQSYEFTTNTESCDLYFWGIKTGSLNRLNGYSLLASWYDLVEDSAKLGFLGKTLDRKMALEKILQIYQYNLNHHRNFFTISQQKELIRSIGKIKREIGKSETENAK